MIEVLAAFLLMFSTTTFASAAKDTEASNKAKSVEEERRYFTEDIAAPMVKPNGYDVTIVEYFDYQCPHCRASHKPLKQLLAKDKKVRVIYRDWPVFGGASVHAALVAVGSKFQGKYLAVHDALMSTPLPLTNAKVDAAATKAGVDMKRLEKDLSEHSEEIEDLLFRNDEQAQMLGLQGTPGFIIGDVQTFGGMDLKRFEAGVRKARLQNKSARAKSLKK